ncbi:MFS transporter [Gardnerella swidsinskii]|jgi:transporter, major facilitator family protein|nr:MFS transporter [Gardnerella swidsinskii]MDK6295139.1 MFS transporter [Gardnerella swidsinskii]MDK7093449.1 MFS transporter [Gardnerella swidsinskii]NSX40774.1 MFS transporter [Gardnerella vaginalis]UQA88526.1 MFS transporter [Gardnerella swidsinskii]
MIGTKRFDCSSVDPYDDPEKRDKVAVRALILLLITFVISTLCLQGFNLVYKQVGIDVKAVDQAPLITGLPGIILGIVCFIYGSLGDFVSLKKLVTIGLTSLFIGSVFGFVANSCFEPNLWTVIAARIMQTTGEQVAGSSFLVIATKYLRNDLKVIFFGLFTASYQLSACIGVFSAGLLSSIAWQYLFLIPALTILILPALLHYLPTKNGNGKKIDVVGFTVFGFAVASLTLFISYRNLLMLISAIILFIIFGIYISKAKEPFVTPAFFKNIRWLSGIILMGIIYFTNYCISPLFNRVGKTLYNMTTSQVASYLVWAFIVAAIFGSCSGLIISRIGRKTGLLLAILFILCGWIGIAVLINSGFLAIALCACVYYAGCGMVYSPLASTILSSLPVEESGRGCGMNDLAISVSASVGVVIFDGILDKNMLSGNSITGASGISSGFANISLMCAAVALLGIIVFTFRNFITKESNAIEVNEDQE